jgi:AcrR family transcriptional regulator
MGSRGRPREFEREKVLRKAMHLFWERGYEGTSLSDLTKAMGIASASIYACFGSKESLFREALALYGTTAAAPPRRALSDKPTARAAIEAMLQATADSITRPDEPHGCMLVLAAPIGGRENRRVRAFLAGLRRDMCGAIKDRLARGVADGDVAASPSRIDAIARYYTTVVEGLSVQTCDGASHADLEAVISCAMAGWDRLASGKPLTSGRTPRRSSAR